MHQRYELSHTDAARVIDAIRAELERDGRGAASAVVDAQGELLAFLRTDGCPLPSITIAINKAFTAARQRQPSFEIGESSRAGQWPLTNFGDPRYTGWGGGIPITLHGQVVGAVGVSGLPETDDMALARMGADVMERG
jgi:glc operon protein GlcG